MDFEKVNVNKTEKLIRRMQHPVLSSIITPVNGGGSGADSPQLGFLRSLKNKKPNSNPSIILPTTTTMESGILNTEEAMISRCGVANLKNERNANIRQFAKHPDLLMMTTSKTIEDGTSQCLFETLPDQ